MIEEILIVDYCRRNNWSVWDKKELPAPTPKWGRPKLLIQTKAKATPKPKVVPGPEDKQEDQNILYPPNQLAQLPDQPSNLPNPPNLPPPPSIPGHLQTLLTHQILQIQQIHYQIHLQTDLIQQIHPQIYHPMLQTHQLLHQIHTIQWIYQILHSHSS